ncbi:helix-turn-helix transcriptional regulator [Nonomuraea sp. NBC_01738]|uniref:AraC family transcriptional regulator n=1 Tax=Nonomuraea sp. NBC_01738 TaxID=2976003 RepID=UPI002E13AF7E|nr:helix-turn-helix transcriptional regulator [Nonomuraea sp. NBC_01738]
MIRHLPEAPTGIRPLAPGDGIDAHHHDTHQIAYARTGVLSVTTRAGAWVAPASRAIWIPAGTVHEHRAYGRTDLRLVGLPVADNPLRLDRPAVLVVGPLLRELLIACTDGQVAGQEAARMRAVLLDRLRRAPEHAVHLPWPQDPRLAAACAVLRDDPGAQVTLASLAASAGASGRTLTRLFQAELGLSFPQWRTQLRLHHALILLAGGEPVTTVAHACGWASASAFIDVFRRAFGHTPGRAFTV